MNRLDRVFARLAERGECALVPFVTGGDPDLDTTEALVPVLAEAGADVIEIGVPFSDPVAEGPTIQRASERALAQGASLRRILALVERVRPTVETPLVLMGYANNFLSFPGFAKAASAVGVDGVIIADLPPEEEPDFLDALRGEGVAPILLAAPTTTPARMERLVAQTRGFLYYVSLTGVTGARAALPEDLAEKLASLRARSEVPVCVGFGIATPEQAAFVSRYADGVVVGSALVERIASSPDRAAAVDAVSSFVASLKAALRKGPRPE